MPRIAGIDTGNQVSILQLNEESRQRRKDRNQARNAAIAQLVLQSIQTLGSLALGATGAAQKGRSLDQQKEQFGQDLGFRQTALEQAKTENALDRTGQLDVAKVHEGGETARDTRHTNAQLLQELVRQYYDPDNPAGASSLPGGTTEEQATELGDLNTRIQAMLNPSLQAATQQSPLQTSQAPGSAAPPSGVPQSALPTGQDAVTRDLGIKRAFEQQYPGIMRNDPTQRGLIQQLQPGALKASLAPIEQKYGKARVEGLLGPSLQVNPYINELYPHLETTKPLFMQGMSESSRLRGGPMGVDPNTMNRGQALRAIQPEPIDPNVMDAGMGSQPIRPPPPPVDFTPTPTDQSSVRESGLREMLAARLMGSPGTQSIAGMPRQDALLAEASQSELQKRLKAKQDEEKKKQRNQQIVGALIG